MAAEVLAGLGAVKTAFDLAKGLKDIHDVTARDRAVIDLQKEILTAQEAQFALVERVRALEAEMTGFKEWDAEKQRYELNDIGDGAVGYMLKPNARGSEPPHWLCPTCYSQGKKAFYQPTGALVARRMVYRCQQCQGNVSIGGEPKWLDQTNAAAGSPEPKAKPKPPGEACPRCGETELRVERSTPHPRFGDMGGINRHMKCDGCAFTETRFLTPK